jgi:enamine deaminase RidA (YjgF/YER057c/UK114 family)
VHVGRVGAELSVDEGRAAAVLAAVNVLAQLKAVLGDLERIGEIVRLEGHVASAPGFVDQPQVLDAASDFLAQALPGPSGHARTAFAHPQLPLDVPSSIVAAG